LGCCIWFHLVPHEQKNNQKNGGHYACGHDVLICFIYHAVTFKASTFKDNEGSPVVVCATIN
jgi:hypothetical protein